MSIDWKAEYLKSVESGCITLDELREARAELAAIKQARSARQEHEPENEPHVSLASVQEPVAWMYPDDYERMLINETFCTVYSVEVGSATRGESSVALYTTPPAAHDLQAELDATNRQVEILSDALAESRREVAALKINAALDKKAENARELGLDYESVPGNFIDALRFDVAMRDAAPVQENTMIYRTFEQWMNGNFLEVKEPRKKAYSKDELLLVEMGWNYGYDAGRAVEQALDKMAENARELGLDYEPALKDNSNYRYDPPVAEPVAYLCENAVGHKYFRWKKPSSTFKPIALYTTPPAASVLEGRDWSLLEATQESLREHMAEIKRLKEAQPVVPDAMTSADIQEHIEYVAGWNDCRQAMLEMTKARGTT